MKMLEKVCTMYHFMGNIRIQINNIYVEMKITIILNEAKLHINLS